MTIAPGTTFGPYTLIAPIGAGGMGEVYRARDTRLGRDVAVKVLPPSISQNPEFLLRFQQEAKAAGMLNHPNLLSIFDVGTAEGAPYIVCELLEGDSLRDRINEAPIPARKVIDYALQVARGLAAAHEKGIVHRDLKPENIFVLREGRLKILDFGLAKLNPAFANDGPSPNQAATEPGMVMGTVGYMSPEQVRGERVDHRSDIFSFGTILYEMLTNNRAFKRDSSIETMSAILRDEPPDLHELNPGTPAELQRIVRRCLEKHKEERFQSARDLAFHLEGLPPLASMATASPHASNAEAPRVSMGSASGVPISSPSPPTAVDSIPQQRPGASERISSIHDAPTTKLATPRPAPRPLPTRPFPSQKPVTKTRQTTRILAFILLATALGGAGFGAALYLQRQRILTSTPQYERVTFRRGEVRSARFTPDGETMLFSAAWDGQPSEIFQARRLSPEARPLQMADADIVAISPAGELALLMRRDRSTGLGTLARVPMMGGTPRELADNVLSADWSPDGEQLAIIRRFEGTFRIEYPIGNVQYDTPHFILDLRISPDGKKIAFLEPQAGAFDVAVLENGVVRSIARGWERGANGLAWAPNGEEIWMTGTSTATPPALYSVSLDGDVRLITRLTGSLRIQDISSRNVVLLTHSVWRSQLTRGTQPLAPLPVVDPVETLAKASNETTVVAASAGPEAVVEAFAAPATETELSWLDWSIVTDMSRDGQMILFNETREGGGDQGSVYLRKTDGSTPVRLGDGFGSALTPDGRWALAQVRGSGLVLLPTGTGEPKPIKATASFEPGAIFLPDGRHVVLAGVVGEGRYALHVLDTETGSTRAISPEGIRGGVFRPFALSPDARTVAGLDANGRIVLYPIGDGKPRSIETAHEGEVPLQWSRDGHLLYVYDPRQIPAHVFTIDLETGARKLWRELGAADPAGLYKIAPVLVADDGMSWVYNSLRTLSDLYAMQSSP